VTTRPTFETLPVACMALGLLAGAGCTGSIDSGGERPELPILTPAPIGLRAITRTQYVHSVRTILGLPDDFAVPPVGPADTSSANEAAADGVTTDAYEASARDVAERLFADDALRGALLAGCTPTLTEGNECIASTIERVGRRAFRRRLGVEELARWTGLAHQLGTTSGDATGGLELAIAGLLQTPSFLYRVELPEAGTAPEGASWYYGSDALATRLAYFLWDGSPDDALLDAAERGELLTPGGYGAAVDRMIADPRIERGIEAYVRELFAVDSLDCGPDGCDPDSEVEGRFRESFARQLLLTARTAVSEEGLRAVFTTRTAFVDASTAALYDLDPADFGDELERVTLPADSRRVGALLTPGFLAMQAYPGKPSVAKRGLFVLRRFLCGSVGQPPGDTPPMLPTLDRLVPTRDLVTMHESPGCASCHARIDPIGLGLENFDATGAWRDTEHGFPIIASGEIDGIAFDDAVGLTEAIAETPDSLRCLTSHLYARATGGTPPGRSAELSRIVLSTDGDARETMRAIVHMNAFRYAWGEMP
jgi:hypothetical protein